MSNEDDKNLFPVTMHHSSSKELPDGQRQMEFVCETVADYLQMPAGLRLGEDNYRRVGWDQVKGVVYYRTGEVEDLLGKGLAE